MSNLHNNSEWAEIIEPRSQQRMFVNLSTGECTWQLPPDTPFQPASNSQWWELFDVASKRFYYYHVASQRTVWQRPRDVTPADIVSLARIQVPQGAPPPNPLQLPVRTGSAHAHSHRSHAHRTHRHERNDPDAANANAPRQRNRPREFANDLDLPPLDDPVAHEVQDNTGLQQPHRAKCSHAHCSGHHHKRRTREPRQSDARNDDSQERTLQSNDCPDLLDGPPCDSSSFDPDSQARRAHHRCTRHQRVANEAPARRCSADAVPQPPVTERCAVPKRQATIAAPFEPAGSPLERERIVHRSVESHKQPPPVVASPEQPESANKNRARRAHRLRRGAQRTEDALGGSSSEDDQVRVPFRKPPLAPLPRRASDSDELDSSSDCVPLPGGDTFGDENAEHICDDDNEEEQLDGDRELDPDGDMDGDDGDGDGDGDCDPEAEAEGDIEAEGDDDDVEEESESDGSLEETVQRIISDVNALQLQVGGGAQPAAVSPRIAQLQQSLLASGPPGAPPSAQPPVGGVQTRPTTTGQVGSPSQAHAGLGRQNNRTADSPLQVQTTGKASPVQAPAVARRPQFPRTNPTISSRATNACKAGSLSPSNGQSQPTASTDGQNNASHTNSSTSITSSAASVTTNASRATGAMLLSEGDSGFSTMPQAPNAPLQLAGSAKQPASASRRAQSGSPFTGAQSSMAAQQFAASKSTPSQQQNVQVSVQPAFGYAGGIFVSPSSSSSSSAVTVASGQSSASGSSTVSSGSFGYVAGDTQQPQAQAQSQSHTHAHPHSSSSSHAQVPQSNRKGSHDQHAHAAQHSLAHGQTVSSGQTPTQSTLSHSSSAGNKPNRRTKQSNTSQSAMNAQAQAQAQMISAAFMQQAAANASGQNMSGGNANVSGMASFMPPNATINNGGRPLSMFMSVHPLDAGLGSQPLAAFQNSQQQFAPPEQVSAQPLFQQPFSLTGNMNAQAQLGGRSQAPQSVPQFVQMPQQFGLMVAQSQSGQTFAQIPFAQPSSQPQYVQVSAPAQFAQASGNGFAQLAQFMQQPAQQFGASQRSPVSHMQRMASVQLPTPPGPPPHSHAGVKPPSRSSSSSSGIPPNAVANAQQNAKHMAALNDNMGTLPISCAGMFFRRGHHPLPPPPPPMTYAPDDDPTASGSASFGSGPLNVNLSGSPTPSCASPDTVTSNPLEQFLEENRKPSKKGLFTKQKSASSLLSFSKDPLAKPLLVESKDKQVRRELLEVFRCIQQYMRDRKFDGDDSQTVPAQNGGSDPLLELVCDVLVARGWQSADVRDEIFLQIGKQLSNNSSLDSMLRGWELLGIALDFFSPSPRLRPFLDEFIQRHVPSAANVQAFAQFAMSGELAIFAVRRYAVQAAKRLCRISKIGRRKMIQRPTFSDVLQSRQTLLEISMFGTSLEELIEVQKERGMTDRRLPWIQTALSEEILRIRGTETEGIFRVSADCDEVARLRSFVEKWALPNGLTDPHVPASLLKLFYRELSEPLIPPAVYPFCIEAHNDAAACVRIVEEQLPALNRLVLSYLVRFLQVFCVAENVTHTKMDINNLAMVMAPNIMRCESDDPDTMFNNTRMEMQFLRNLIQHLDTSCVEGVQ